MLYLYEGKWGDAGLSVLSAVPFVGGIADGGKSAKLALPANKCRDLNDKQKQLCLVF